MFLPICAKTFPPASGQNVWGKKINKKINTFKEEKDFSANLQACDKEIWKTKLSSMKRALLHITIQ